MEYQNISENILTVILNKQPGSGRIEILLEAVHLVGVALDKDISDLEQVLETLKKERDELKTHILKDIRKNEKN